MRFLIDGMLGSLSRWLRIIGYDSEYRRSTIDEDLIKEAQRTGRILLTKDRNLVIRSKKSGIKTQYVEGSTNEERLRFLIKTLGLDVNTTNSRCPICNGCLNKIEKEIVIGKVPSMTFKNFNIFWLCKNCGKVYWRGSHWEKISKMLRSVDPCLK